MINETKSWLFEKINKSVKLLARLTKNKWEKTQINKIRSEKGELITDSTEVSRIGYYEQLYVDQMDNLEEMDKLLERYSLPRLNKE